MLAKERQTEILATLSETGAARVTDLARALRVVEETIRRDLDRLASEGRLVRVHGGAVQIPESVHDAPLYARRAANMSAKKAIARQALTHVTPGDILAFDASSTVHQLALLLPDNPATVITNSLPASAALLRKGQVHVISTGGSLDATSWSWIGSLAEQALDQINVRKLFLSTKGVDPDRGLSEAEDAQARVKLRMMEVAEEIYLLVDHSKFGVRSVVTLAPISEVDFIITDSQADSNMVERLRNCGVRVEIAQASTGV